MTHTATNYGTICDECGQRTHCDAEFLTDDGKPSGLFLCNDCIVADEEYQARRIELARTIKGWRQDIATMDRSPSVTAMLCYCWNYATDPARLHTDEEARVLRKLARACRKRLIGRTCWTESESGRLIPTHSPNSTNEYR